MHLYNFITLTLTLANVQNISDRHNSSFKYQYLDDYVNFVNKYNKNYDTSEFWYRYWIFSDNLKHINNFNSQNNTYSLGINKYTDLEKSEFKDKYLTNSYNFSYVLNRPLPKNFSSLGIPTSIDWRAKSLVTNVKDQLQCGSCWAFSAVGVIEGQYAKKTGNLTSFSEQDLVDCSDDYGNLRCGGGWPEAAMRYVIKNGIETEDEYKYKAIDEACTYNKSLVVTHLSRTVNITNGSMPELYRAIANVGPVSIAIDAGDNFQFYKSGIFTDTTCSKTMLDHAVLAVGYDEIENHKYIIVKNSWNTDWGMDGYIYMNADINNMCGMATSSSYALI